jgi:hypothetical protein
MLRARGNARTFFDGADEIETKDAGEVDPD